MFTIKCENITFKYEDSVEPIIKDLSLDINAHDRVAIIGSNGKGKSTLIRLILGELHPNKGQIIKPKQSLRMAYLSQNDVIDEDANVIEYCLPNDIKILQNQIEYLENILTENQDTAIIEHYGECMIALQERDAYQIEHKCEKILKQLGFKEGILQRKISTLSGGEKSKLKIVRMLLEDPELLILDEANNHLDIDMIEWLEDFLHNFSGAVLFVSHDRSFIDHLATKIMVMERQSYCIMKSNYSEYLQQKEDEFHLQMTRYTERQAKISQLESAAQARRKWASSFQRETGREGKSYAFEMVTNPAKQMMRQAKSIEARIRNLEEKDPVQKPWIEKKREIQFIKNSLISQTVFTLKDICLSFGETKVFDHFNLMVERQERIHLRGRNGSGKSSLLKLLNGIIHPDSGEILYGQHLKIRYFAQELEFLDFQSNILEYLLRFNSDQTYVRTVMGCLKIERDQIYQQIGSLSAGEQVKVSLCAILIQESNVLLLDEPANHLDIDSRIALEQALLQYPGTIIFVSHDRTFANTLASRVIDLSQSI